MNILILAQQFFPDRVGGAGRVAFEQAKGLAARGHTVIACVPRWETSAERREVIAGITVHRYGHPPGIFGQSITDVRELPHHIPKLLREFHPQVVLAHQPTVAHAYLKIREKKHPPLLYLFHASAAREIRFQGVTGRGAWWKQYLKPFFVIWFRGIEAAVVERADRIGVLSAFSARWLDELYGVSGPRVVRLKVGADVARFQPGNKRAARVALGVPEDARTILTVRRLVSRMGLEHLVQAMRGVVGRVAEVRLYIAGEGPLASHLKRLIHLERLDDYVFLLGRVPEEHLPLLYQAADLFVLPTRVYEGLGMATLEALASGLPVVGTPVGATPEILSQLDERLILKGTAAEDITEGILWYFEKGEHIPDLRGRARALVLERYTWDAAAADLEAALRDLKVL